MTYRADDLLLGQVMKKSDLESRNIAIYNNSLIGVPTGDQQDGENLYEIVSGNQLVVGGVDGGYYPVSQGVGLGIRQHNDVMLAAGFSRKVKQKISLSGGDFALISLTVPEGLHHHAEARILRSFNEEVNFKVILGKARGDLTGTPVQIPAFDQRGPSLDPAVQTIFEYWGGAFGTNPVSGVIDDSNTVDDVDLYATSGGFFTASSADVFASVVGRYYYPGFYVVLIENLGASTAEVDYIYEWHEFN